MIQDRPTRSQTLTALLRKEDDLYVAECPEIGTVSQGLTVEGAIANLKEATELYLEEFPAQDFAPSPMTHFEVEIRAGASPRLQPRDCESPGATRLRSSPPARGPCNSEEGRT